MTRTPLLALVFLAASVAFAGAPLAVETTKTSIDYTASFQGSASSWTVFADGRIQEVIHTLDMPGPRLRTGKLPAKVLAGLLKRAKEQKLDTIRFTQPEGPPLLREGVTRLRVLGNTLEPPLVGEFNAESKAILASMEAFAEDLAKTFAPHLSEAHGAGTYVAVQAFSDAEQAQLKKLGRLNSKLEEVDSPRLRAALETPGLWVRLGEGEQVKRGQIQLVGGRAVIWSTREFVAPKAK